MKKSILLVCLLIAGTGIYAQPWMPKGNTPVKFLDIVSAYEGRTQQEREEDEEEREREQFGKAIEEDGDYQFDRWCWYWRQHLDTAGYMVKGYKANKEWQAFLAANKPKGAAAKTTATDNWSFVGPKTSAGGYSGIGRVNTVAFHPVDSNIIYVGSASGSAWKTTDGGSTWQALYDNMLALTVSDIKVNPLNGNTVYVATGDADGGSDYSIGILKSYDAGATWTNIGPSSWTPDSFKMSGSLLINPLDTSKLILATSDGVYKSGDGGATWQKTSTTYFKQLLFCPADTSFVYGASASPAAQVYRSTDGGFTWGPVTTLSGATRINIAVCPSAPTVIMAIAATSTNGLMGIYQSPDYGSTFNPVYTDGASCNKNLLSGDNSLPTSTCNGQGWYDLCIAIDPDDQNKVVIGGINNYYSTDGGVTWSIANQWYNAVSGLQVVHADKHWLGYNPLNHGLYLGCDGGIYKTYAPMTYGGWKDLSNGLGITQFYRNAVANDVTFCLGGAQDNGSKKVDGSGATDLTGGDGMVCLFNYANPADHFYTATQRGYVRVTYDGGGVFASITDDLPTPGAWITPYIIHPTEPSTLLIGYKQVFRTTDGGTGWNAISPVFSTTGDILVLSIANSDPNYIYAVRDAGTASRIHYTTNSGTAWAAITPPFTAYISDLVVDPRNEKHFWVTLSGYSAQKVYSYDLATGVWTDESAGLPSIPVNCMVIDTFSQTKYVGNDAAVFYKTSTMTSWALYNTNLPGVQVNDLNINHTTNEIWAATYGRGMWKSGKAELSPVKVRDIPALVDKITIAPNPCHDVFTVSTPGVTFRNTAVRVRLVAADGRTVLSTDGIIDNTGKLDVNIAGTPAGFYICDISSDKGTARAKLVVQ